MKLIIEVINGKVQMQAENMNMVDFTVICGALQQMAGLEAIKRGKTLDEIKDSLWDIYAAAMEGLEKQVGKEVEDAS